MRKIIALTIAAALTSYIADAQDFKFFNHWGLGAMVGTEGITADIGTCLSGFIILHGGVNFMPNITTKRALNIPFPVTDYYTGQISTITADASLKGEIKRLSGHVMLDILPLGSKIFPFFITIGAHFGGDRIFMGSIHSEKLKEMYASSSDEVKYQLAQIQEQLKKYNVTANEEGDIIAAYTVNPVRPYIGIGAGSYVPKKRVGFRLEVGAQFNGKSNIINQLNSSKEEFKNMAGLIGSGQTNEALSKIFAVMDKVYPCIKIGVTVRLF